MGARKTVLIVDDSQAVLDTLEMAFGGAGFDVSAASDGEEVFRRMSQADPDAMLLDVYMPKLNGADVCRMVKAHPHWRKVFLVVMSSRIRDHEVAILRHLGADEVLRKPFDPAWAVALVERALAGRAG